MGSLEKATFLLFRTTFKIFGCLERNMSHHNHTPTELEENDPLWELLAQGKKFTSLEAGPWFASRTTAKAKNLLQSTGLLQDVLLFARESAITGRFGHFLKLGTLGVIASLAMMALHPPYSLHPSLGLENAQASSNFVSSEDDFQEHIELLTSAD